MTDNILVKLGTRGRAFLYNLLPEIGLCIFMSVAVVLLAQVAGLSISLPNSNVDAFYDSGYLYQIIIAIAVSAFLFLSYKHHGLSLLFSALLYVYILMLHFNMKWWMVYINPASWDEFYWQTDQAIYPIIAACFWLRELLIPLIPRDSNAYLFAYLAMYIFSLCYHSYRDGKQLRARSLILSMMIFHMISSFAYLVAPALGPFLYEEGFSPAITELQGQMHGLYKQALAQGPSWLEANASNHLIAGLGAMPSLHIGGILLLCFYAWERKNRWITSVYSAMLIFVIITSVASRWHYVIDLPFGALIAWVSYKGADWYLRFLDKYFGYAVIPYTQAERTDRADKSAAAES